MAVSVHGVVYVKGGRSLCDGGDFSAMICDPSYDDTLFLFNDNVRDGAVRDAPVGGSGSAVIRPYTTRAHGRRAVGIPTGWMAGAPFARLDDQVRMVVDLAFERANTVLALCGYTRVVFPCDAHDRTRIGSLTFRLPRDVVDYISEKMAQVSRRAMATAVIPLSFLNQHATQWVSDRLRAEEIRLQEERRSRAIEAASFGRQPAPWPAVGAAASARTGAPPTHRFPAGTLDNLLTRKRRLIETCGDSSSLAPARTTVHACD